MNRIYRTLWNAVRQCFVVANENAGSAQSRGCVITLRGRLTENPTGQLPRSSFSRINFRSLSVAFLTASLFMAGPVSAATYTLTCKCSSAGGTLVNGIYKFIGKSTGTSGLTRDSLLSSGSALIQGGTSASAEGIHYQTRRKARSFTSGMKAAINM